MNSDELASAGAEQTAAAAGAPVTVGHHDPDEGYAVVVVNVDADGAHITDHGRYCPAGLPCLGRPAVGIAVPVRSAATGEQLAEVHGVYCPRCRTMAADARR